MLQRLNSDKFKTIRHKLFLYSCDFESLYTNINPIDAVRKITDYLEKEFSSKHFNSKYFKIILELIFKNNIFIYDNKYFVQKIGLPMGCKCGLL